MPASITVSRTEPGSADAVRAVSVVSTGTVSIHPEHPFGTRKPLYWWLLTSRRWTPPRPVNAYVIEHAKGLILFDTGQDRASVTDDAYFPGGFTGVIYDRLARFDIGEQDTLTAQLGALGYAPGDVNTAILSHLHQDHIGGIAELKDADLLVSAAEWAELSKPAPEPRGFLRKHIQVPGSKWHQISLEPTSDPALAPFTESLDVMGDGSLVLLATPGHTAGSISLLIRRASQAAAASGRRPHLRSRAAAAPPGSRRGQPAPASRDHRQSPGAQKPDAGPGHPARPRPHRCRAPARQLTQETTMQTFENTVTIRKPAEEVFAFLADFENIPTWNYAIEQTRKSSAGPVGVGTRYRQTRSVPGRSIEDFEVTVFEPARRLAIQGQIGPFQATISYELEAAAGATRLVNNVELDPSQPC